MSKPTIHGDPVGWMDGRGWLISHACKAKYFRHYTDIQKGYDEPVFTAKQLGVEGYEGGPAIEARLLADESNPEPAHRAALGAIPSAPPPPSYRGDGEDRRMLHVVLEELRTMTLFCDACDHDHRSDNWDVTLMLEKHLK